MSGTWPSGHSVWAFRGLAEFHARVGRFLAQGAARGERLLLVEDDPRPGQWPSELLEREVLRLASVAEVYGSARLPDPTAQEAVFDQVLGEALADGYVGLRIAADNTSVATGGERLAAWCRWEARADRFMAAEPVTGLCAFDRVRLDAGDLRLLVGLHEVRVGPEP